ncbi:hypothetical protein SNE510_28860 [Streptomyces sp. NE5-10]|uniref:peptidase inhibitor family I36 protein n=1 Tax=Streptomyces sp. NE5-10 TaxID=2759674 RepID=UPI001904655C|nr:peptidase inhibitor family I36 protein [Streptomyces sp. NE5-10]GHJ93367.1 hypothetical protein SNE510_28860 [Streptomyces sp. NE5-10]
MRTTPRRRAAATATTLGLAPLVIGGGAAPAQAAIGDCPQGYFCAWANDDGTGPMFKTRTSAATLGTWDNKIRTRMNRTGSYACFFGRPNYTEGYSWDSPAQVYATSGGSTEISSIKLVPTLRECEGKAYPYWKTAVSPKAAGFGDMTGDGRADLVAREKATGKLWLYPGTSTRILGARKLVGAGGWNSMDHFLGVGDTTGDGRPDLQAADNGALYQYQGLAGGGLREVDDGNYSWWALEGAGTF